MKAENIIYPDNWEGYGMNELSKDQGFRASYYYMHGKLEDDSGYDCCNVSGKLLSYLLCEGIYLAKCSRNNKTCLVFSCCEDMNRMKGRMCYIDDLKAIESILVNQLEAHINVRFSNDKTFVREKFIETYDLLKKLYNRPSNKKVITNET
jgi:hypothetical protein